MSEDRVPEPGTTASPPRRSLSYDDLTVAEQLGSGGRGVVSLATVPGSEPPDRVALKQPAAEGTLSRSAMESFLDEAGTWAMLDERERTEPRWADSDHVVGIVATGDQLPWIAMEYMDGGDLADRLAAAPDGLPVREALWVAESVCRGVELAHSYGVAHLDLKPANVLFRATGPDSWDQPKIGDWGLARDLSTGPGGADGLSPAYAAPEQFDESYGEPDTLTDVYQLGTLCYALLTGEPPYTGTGVAVASAVTDDGQPPAPSSRRDGLPDGADEVVLRALATAKRDRFDGVITLRRAVADLRAAARDDPTTAGGAGPRTGTAAESAGRTAAESAGDTATDDAAAGTVAADEGTDRAAGDGSPAGEFPAGTRPSLGEAVRAARTRDPPSGLAAAVERLPRRDGDPIAALGTAVERTRPE